MHSDFKSGTDYSVHITGAQSVDITSDAVLTGDFKLEGIIPLKFTCAVCGAECKITIPIIGKDIDVNLPDCPISGMSIKNDTTVTMAAVPVALSAKGTLTITQGGTTLLDMSTSITATTSDNPLKEEVEQMLGPVEKKAMHVQALNYMYEKASRQLKEFAGIGGAQLA